MEGEGDFNGKKTPAASPQLIPYYLHGSNLFCYSPIGRKFQQLPLPDSVEFDRSCATSNGWILLNRINSDNLNPSLLNPISGVHIKLPPFALLENSHILFGAMSAAPTRPDCTVLFGYYDRIFLQRVKDNGDWTCMAYPETSTEPVDREMRAGHGVYCGGKFYCLYGHLFVVDPRLPTPSVQVWDMDCRQLAQQRDKLFLVESGGELLMVVGLYAADYRTIEEFRVFRADLSQKTWVRAKELGGRVLFLGDVNSLSLLATDVGCKANCIYFHREVSKKDEELYTWRVFDLDIQGWMDGPTLPCASAECDLYHLRTWFVRQS